MSSPRRPRVRRLRRPSEGREGAPSKLTPALQEAICKDIAARVPETTAARANGIPDRTYFVWKAKGARPQAAAFYRQFHQAVEKALAEAERGCVVRIVRASERYWQAAAWMLERRWPDTWARRERLEHGGVGGANEVIVKHVIVWEDQPAIAHGATNGTAHADAPLALIE